MSVASVAERLPSPTLVRPALRVGPADDPAEREADAVADAIMSTPESVARGAGAGSAPDSAAPVLRRACGCGGCDELRRQPDGDEELQMKAVTGRLPGGVPVGADIARRIEAKRPSGASLTPEVRAFFEPRFGTDLTAVRLHRDSEAAALASSVNARAFTIGCDVFLGAGEGAFTTTAGRRLLAHELTHTVQQEGVIRRQAGPRRSLLRDCRTLGHGSALDTAVSRGAALARDCHSALDQLLSTWGADEHGPSVLSARNALARGFNIEADKRVWVDLLGMDRATVAQRDRQDRTVTERIRDNFGQIAADAPRYASAPACPTRMTAGQPCFGCVAAAHPRCRRGVTAYVPQPFLGQPSSAVLFCPDFFSGSEDRAVVFLHELSHLQSFAASDLHAGTRYYGCPVAPVDGFGRPLPSPGLWDPGALAGIADAYACFASTFLAARPAHRRAAAAERSARQSVRDVLGPVPEGGR